MNRPPTPTEHTPMPRCAIKDCPHVGIHQTPLGPHDLHTRLWLCLGHAREHNARWNAFEGLSTQEIEKLIRFDTVWERPSWPLGKGPLARRQKHAEKPKKTAYPAAVLAAFACLDIAPTDDRRTVKTRVRVLSKKHHPDMNKGRETESSEAFQKIRRAATTIEKWLLLKMGG